MKIYGAAEVALLMLYFSNTNMKLEHLLEVFKYYALAKPRQKFFDTIMKPLSLSLTIMINMDLTQTRRIGGFQLS